MSRASGVAGPNALVPAYALVRIYREERLVVRKRGGRRRVLGSRAPATVPQGKNQRWSLDFVSDTFADGLIAWRGRPAMVVSENGTEPASMAILRWQQETGQKRHHLL